MAIGALSGVARAADQTWQLQPDGTWKTLGDDPQSRYVLAVAEVKTLISTGKVAEAQAALAKLKADYPGLAGPDLDAFAAAEQFYARRKWDSAIRKYDDFLDKHPDSWLFESALERQYSVATAFLNGEKRRVLRVIRLSAYEEGATIMQKIADRAGDAPIARRSLITLARSYEQRDKYLDAYEIWSDIASRWPTGQMGQTALLEMAQSLHSAYKGPLYDHSPLASAASYYTNYKLRYPEDGKAREIDKQIDMITEQTAYKQYSLGRYYYRTGDHEAARYYFRYVADTWPGSTAARMAGAWLKMEPQQMVEQARRDRKPVHKAVDVTGRFLDKWFGIQYVTDRMRRGAADADKTPAPAPAPTEARQ